MNRKAQHLIFSATLVLFLFFLATTLFYDSLFTPPDMGQRRYEAVSKQADRLSDTLVMPGYPLDWNENNVERAGLATDGELNNTKLTQLEKLADDDYEEAKSVLGIRSDYHINVTSESRTVSIGKRPQRPDYLAVQRRTLKDEDGTARITISVYEDEP
ncbi:hypothetical protein KY327_03515 [Candidatus Woesearchaeota archaeon]|nr:hypothetical protein [Candidatus Woesearchaeota archaeon]